MQIFYSGNFSQARLRLAFAYAKAATIIAEGATLPVIAFFLLGIYGKAIWLVIANVILDAGHIGLHLVYRKEINECKDSAKTNSN